MPTLAHQSSIHFDLLETDRIEHPLLSETENRIAPLSMIEEHTKCDTPALL